MSCAGKKCSVKFGRFTGSYRDIVFRSASMTKRNRNTGELIAQTREDIRTDRAAVSVRNALLRRLRRIVLDLQSCEPGCYCDESVITNHPVQRLTVTVEYDAEDEATELVHDLRQGTPEEALAQVRAGSLQLTDNAGRQYRYDPAVDELKIDGLTSCDTFRCLTIAVMSLLHFEFTMEIDLEIDESIGTCRPLGREVIS
jgi:hypothetical protein